jgi:hypothetical protein
MSTWGVYNPGTNSANTYAMIAASAPNPSRENVQMWGQTRGFVEQSALSVYHLNFTSPRDGWYQTHITADYTYTITLDQSGSPNIFGELNWFPKLSIFLTPPYSNFWSPPNCDITDIFADLSPGTHTGYLDVDDGPAVYLFAGDNMDVTMATEIAAQNWGLSAAGPIPASFTLFSIGILGLAGLRRFRKG